jgi:3',5'-cyclic AMP phosphodiesterase CpdA
MSFFWFVSVFTITCTALVFFSISNQSMLNAFSQTVSTPFHEESGASDNQIASEFKFVTVGDWDCNEDTVNTINDITQRNPDFILALGDYSYENTPDCWLELVDPIDEKMKIVIGNHENKITDDEGDRVYSPELLNQYLNHFNLPNPYYSFDKGDVHFLVLSTETEYDEGSAQFRFAVDDLSKAADNPEVQWIIVAHHRPITYVSDNSASDYGSSDFRDLYHPLFEYYSVDLVLTAHAHNYERTYPLQYNTDSPESCNQWKSMCESVEHGPIITDRNKRYYNNPEGQIFATIGTGGATIFEFVGEAPYFTAERYEGFGLAEIKVTENPSRLEFTFFGDGERVEDTFIITK